MKKVIAVILVNYNGIVDTIECIESIKKCKNYDEITIVVVDNASLAHEEKNIQKRFPDVVCIGLETNLGFAAGNNVGIKWALEHDYQYIMLLNNDTVIDPGMINILKESCDNNTVTVPKMLYYSKPDMIWYGGGYINKRTGNAKHEHMGELDKLDTKTRTVTFATGCCMFFSSDTIKRVGLLDETYFMYCEDTDYCLRLQYEKTKIVYLPTAKLWHKISSSTGGDFSAFNIYYMTRNRIEVVKKYKSYFLFTALPFTVLSRVARMYQFKMKKNSNWPAFRLGIKDGLKNIKGKSLNFEAN